MLGEILATPVYRIFGVPSALAFCMNFSMQIAVPVSASAPKAIHRQSKKRNKKCFHREPPSIVLKGIVFLYIPQTTSKTNGQKRIVVAGESDGEESFNAKRRNRGGVHISWRGTKKVLHRLPNERERRKWRSFMRDQTPTSKACLIWAGAIRPPEVKFAGRVCMFGREGC